VPQEITVSNNEFFSTNAQTSVYPSRQCRIWNRTN
jgi:hypothetical protein